MPARKVEAPRRDQKRKTMPVLRVTGFKVPEKVLSWP
jgi:hypothetical protein